MDNITNEILDGQLLDDALASAPAPELPSAHQAFIQALRDIADFYQARPDIPLPYHDRLDVFPQERQLASIAKGIGACEKAVLTDSYFILRKRFGPLCLEFNWSREQVCERVVVGRETIEEKVPVAYETRVVERDKVEWHCPKSIIGKPALPATDEVA